MIEEAKIRASKLKEFESEIAVRFLKKYEELEEKWGKKGMKEKMEADEALEWLIAIESFYIDLGLLEYEDFQSY